MYYGKTTRKLEQLYAEYEKVWNHNPSGYMEIEYGEDEYQDYVKDIKRSLKMGVELPELYPHDDEF